MPLWKSLLNVDMFANGDQLGVDDGRRLQADRILSAVGLRPCTQLARDAGLAGIAAA